MVPLSSIISSTRLKVKRYTDGYPCASYKGYKTWRQADQAWQDVLDRRNAEWAPTPTAFQVQIDTTVQNDDLETVLSSSLEASSVSAVEHDEEWWVLLEGDRPGVYDSLTDVREAEGTADRCVRQKTERRGIRFAKVVLLANFGTFRAIRQVDLAPAGMKKWPRRHFVPTSEQALLDWEETFRPRLDTNKEGAGVPVAQVIGAFTTSTELGNILYRMGIPVWFLRPSREVVNAHVRDLAGLNPPSTSLLLAPCQYQRFSIFKGRNTDPVMYGKMMYQLHAHIRYPNPFGRDVAPTNPLAPPLMSSSSSPSSSTSSLSSVSSAPTGRVSSQKSSKRLTPYLARNRSNPQAGDAGRNKFTDPSSPLLPPALPIWLSALQNINQYNLPSFHSSNDALDLSYVFPEPASLVAVTNVGRRTSMFKTWLRFRPAFFYRLTNDNSNATPMPARVWKEFLTVNFLESNPNSNKKSTDTPVASRSAKTLAYAQDFYQSLLNEDGVCVTSSSRPFLPSTWRGKPFDNLVNSDFQEILWEINELSFRFEFMALDSRLSSDADKPFHHVDVDECFPTAESGSLLVVDVTKANSGIASAILDQRSRAFLAIRTVMQKWEGRPLPPLIASTHAIAWDNIDSLEREIAIFYTQTFFNHFHRAPIIPRWLPHLPQTVLPSPFQHKMMNPRPNIYYDLGILDRGV
ncbi:hypothetical protein BDN72DRAFT_905871 [Pluteus cervinus]|uniref:Uncharacterized protein n=1 Tax=Pluteus cervinus TaxID=181527 RepID=A0ACD3A152_9AGAR|nr:hypothetical protein BDN72DRAFT_905871 [Pluteus cervinus]